MMQRQTDRHKARQIDGQKSWQPTSLGYNSLPAFICCWLPYKEVSSFRFVSIFIVIIIIIIDILTIFIIYLVVEFVIVNEID